MSRQEATRISQRGNNLGRIEELKVNFFQHQPHWKRSLPPDELKGSGASLEFALGTYNTGTSLSIDAREWYSPREGRISEKRVMVSLDEAAARQLWALLTDKFGGV